MRESIGVHHGAPLRIPGDALAYREDRPNGEANSRSARSNYRAGFPLSAIAVYQMDYFCPGGRRVAVYVVSTELGSVSGETVYKVSSDSRKEGEENENST